MQRKKRERSKESEIATDRIVSERREERSGQSKRLSNWRSKKGKKEVIKKVSCSSSEKASSTRLSMCEKRAPKFKLGREDFVYLEMGRFCLCSLSLSLPPSLLLFLPSSFVRLAAASAASAASATAAVLATS